ncbi:peptidoglycan DD-metalloendopeptidase family protein [Iodobacter sp. CM08]|uniref:peptidoglycan DD-metalloendopeptidase family protein n=1 Tax=Iodobacter sp. CM08 TaxID=3085902 RepID=UPI0029815932|nr:peptidoglycan DD-metalloendopeptidase family protein [Iodobacter sp. CM08]MDW5415860.1 peptidoglycan DD-metalloendopeptidase family protein [Iodobacter sp. CM08]
MPIFPLLRRYALFSTLLISACGTAPISNSSQYEVKTGDTLYSIARNHNLSVSELQRLNQLSDTTIQIGQTLTVKPSPKTANVSTPSLPTPSRPTPAANKPAPAISLIWPSKGPVLQNYNGGSNKGIDIGGAAGSPIYAAASGKVAYAGNGIRSYGNLLIIKHNQDYLSAYAHNQRILVKEGDMIKQGQQVAEMGSSGSNKVKLHFELRFKGKAINPKPFLAE